MTYIHASMHTCITHIAYKHDMHARVHRDTKWQHITHNCVAPHHTTSHGITWQSTHDIHAYITHIHTLHASHYIACIHYRHKLHTNLHTYITNIHAYMHYIHTSHYINAMHAYTHTHISYTTYIHTYIHTYITYIT